MASLPFRCNLTYQHSVRLVSIIQCMHRQECDSMNGCHLCYSIFDHFIIVVSFKNIVIVNIRAGQYDERSVPFP